MKMNSSEKNSNNFYKGIYKKAHLSESVYSGILDSINIDYLYEYASSVCLLREMPMDMEELDSEDISPRDAIRKALNGRSFIGGEFNLADDFVAVEDDENFVSIPKDKLRDYLISIIGDEDDFVEWCVDNGFIGRKDVSKANRDYYIG